MTDRLQSCKESPNGCHYWQLIAINGVTTFDGCLWCRRAYPGDRAGKHLVALERGARVDAHLGAVEP
jgi:hypothetical protein